MSWEAAVDSWLLTVCECLCVYVHVLDEFSHHFKSICARMLVGFARLLRPCSDTHTYTLFHFSEASPALETLHTRTRKHTHVHTHTHVKVQGFAKLQQTGSLLTALQLCHCCHWNWSKLAVLLAPELLAVSAGSLVSPYFFISLHVCVCKSVCVFTQTSGI